jgi:citrate synthase
MRDILVKLADKFDQEGKTDLANEVDSLLLTTAARPAAPLKTLDENVKKDLLGFIHRVKENIDNSTRSLDEFFRRLRYFDIGETVKDLKLDKTFKELSKISASIDAAKRSMYALTYGKNPSRADLEQLAEDFGSEKEEIAGPLEFFESQVKPDVDDERKKEMEEEGIFEASHSRDDEWKEYHSMEDAPEVITGLPQRKIDEALEDEVEPDVYDAFMRDLNDLEDEEESFEDEPAE